MKKRIWAMALVVVLALSLVPVSAAGSLQEEEGAQWITVEGIEGGEILFDSETGSVQDSKKTVTSANIPSSIDGISVNCIADNAFSDCVDLTNVTIPTTVSAIGAGAFAQCKKLISIDIPDSVTEIGSSVFSGCSSLSQVALSENLEKLGAGAFLECDALKEIKIPESVVSLGAHSFSHCDNLEKVVFYTKTISIVPSWGEYGIFIDCPKLVSMGPIGSNCNVEFAWEEAFPEGFFEGFSSLEKIYIPTEISGVGGLGGLNKLESAGPLGSNCDIEFGWTTEIPDFAFNASGLKQVILPENLSSIGSYAFSQCVNLSTIDIPEMVRTIEYGAFQDSGLVEIDIPEGTAFINSSVFYECDKLSSVTIPDSVRGIGTSAFAKCSNLTSIKIPANVNVIETDAFRGCSKLESIILPDKITEISSHTFRDCESLKSITIPAGVTAIGSQAFENCAGLKDVYYKGNKSAWENMTIGANNDDLLHATIHYGDEDPVQPAEVTLTFETNGGSKITPLPVAADTTVDLTKYVPTKEGYAFAGWYADRNLTTQVTALKLAADTTVYAKWLPAQYTLTFETNGGSKINALSVGAGTTVDLTQYVPVRAGYDFAGWYADRKLTTQVTFLKPTADTTVYAKWEKEAPVLLPFLDVTKSDWFYEDVAYVYENGLMNGVGEGLFGPGGTTTRAMVVTILYRLEGEPTVTGDTPFTDLVAGQYYLDAVAWASTNDIVNGVTSTTFAPNDPITREQMAAILYRYAQYKGMDTTDRGNLGSFADGNTVSPYAVEAMAWANAEGLVNGVENNRLNPTGQAPRSQVAAILHRFCTME